MQTRELIEHQREMALVFLADAEKKRNEAMAKLEAARPGSRERRQLYEKHDEAERRYLRNQATVETLEWVLSEPVQLRWFTFRSRQPFDSLPATGVNDLGRLAFYETTPEARRLLVEQRGFSFITSAPDVRSYSQAHEQARLQGQPEPTLCWLETPAEFDELARQLAPHCVFAWRPDYTN